MKYNYEISWQLERELDKLSVLVFEIVETENKVIFMDFDHHDNIY